MKKIILAFMLMAGSSAFAQNISTNQLHTKSTVCMDGIMYFVGFSFHMGIERHFISSVKIDPKTMLPQRCI